MNAKQELLEYLNSFCLGVDDIDYSAITFKTEVDNTIERDSLFTKDSCELLSFLDRIYDNNSRDSVLVGVIVFKNRSWIERVHYDNAEWWVYRDYPTEEVLKTKMELGEEIYE